MKRSDVRPTGVERTFDQGRFIVSKTDAKGIIRYVNRLFLDVSAYSEQEVLNQPHNLVRHPDMPRGVFKLLWDRLNAGEEVFAYIVNLAADGAHYWVFAHVTPTTDHTGRIVGHHSNRRVADPAAIKAIEPIYRAMLAEERKAGRASEAADAGFALLTATLAEQGKSYDEFVWDLTAAAATGALR